MKKLFLSILVLALVAPVQSQTVATQVAAARQTANDQMCNAFALPDGCLDSDIQLAWCTARNIQTNPVTMCAAVDARVSGSDKQFATDLEYAQFVNAAKTADKLAFLKGARIRAIDLALQTKSAAQLLTICQAIPGAVCQ